MQLLAFCKAKRLRSVATKRTIRIMKAITIILFAFSLQTSARNLTQEITLSLRNVKLETVFKEIQKQTSYRFVYTKEQLESSRSVSVDVKKAQLEAVLQLCFREQPLTYTIEDRFIIISIKDKVEENKSPSIQLIDITGRITNEQGEPLPGASISVKGTNKGTATNSNGEFILQGIEPNAILIISSVGYQMQTLRLHGNTNINIQLKLSVNSLEETIIKGYYNTSKRLNTGSVSKVTADDIGNQPVSNPLAALQGSSPGLLITQANGIPGSNFNVTIRGNNSIQNGNSPLYIIDGTPFINDADILTQRSVINSASPFNTLDPSQIESIEILKDADATAIYGSRGANGVILITTKKGKAEAIKTEVNIYTGWGKVTRTMEMMNTSQYLQLRNEAFRNDSVSITPGNGYDLLVWDTTRFTDFKKELIGQTAHINNVTLHISGGSNQVSFSSGVNYYSESTVFAGNSSENRISVYSGITYKSHDKKFIFGLNGNYASDKNDLIKEDLTQYINLPPVLPELYDSSGNLNWSKGGFSFANPLSATLQTNKVITDRITASNTIQYTLLNNLAVKINSGYNQLNTDEYNNTPIAAQDPVITPTGTAFFGTNIVKSWIIEPQIDFRFSLTKKLKVQSMLGATWQENRGKISSISASGYTNDRLLGSVANAASNTVQNRSELYRYNAVFGRLHFNWDDKYLLNLTGRRDGSSRFGPGNQFANFGAIGFAWLFSNEGFIRKNLKLLSYGKLRLSYGTTGNDLIGNYQYLDSYSPTRFAYQGIPSLFPTKLYNSEYGWEEIKKINAGIELGFLKDRILITGDWFTNKSSDQIISYSLPGQTGFISVLKNFPGVVQNKGLEIQITSINIQGKSLTWKSNFNLTVSKNRLIEFPGLATSSYAQRYRIGKPLNAYIGARFAGVDPVTGVYQFFDKNKNLTFSPSSDDYIYAGTTDPKFYGGFQNSIKYKQWELSFLFEFRKQMGLHPVYSAPSLVGDAINRPVAVLNRWQYSGQVKPYQRFTQTFGAAGNAIYPLFNSDAVLTDASFIRMKNLAMSYTVPASGLAKYKITSIELFVQAQNLFVISDYKGPDPETQRVRSLPPLRRIVTGIKLIL